MAERPVSRSELIKFTEAIRQQLLDFSGKFDTETRELGRQMGDLKVELAETRGQSVPSRIVALEERIRQLEDSRAKVWGALAIVSFVGMPGVALLIHHFSK